MGEPSTVFVSWKAKCMSTAVASAEILKQAGTKESFFIPFIITLWIPDSINITFTCATYVKHGTIK